MPPARAGLSWPERVRKISARGKLAQVTVLEAILVIRQAQAIVAAGLSAVVKRGIVRASAGCCMGQQHIVDNAVHGQDTVR